MNLLGFLARGNLRALSMRVGTLLKAEGIF